MFHISPQLQQTSALFPRKNLENREPPYPYHTITFLIELQMKRLQKCHHQCVNTEFAAECICHEGFELSSDGINCIDYDECQVNNGGCEDKCVNLQPSYKCACLGDKMLAQDQFRNG